MDKIYIHYIKCTSLSRLLTTAYSPLLNGGQIRESKGLKQFNFVGTTLTLKEETSKNGIRLLYETLGYFALRRPMAAFAALTTSHTSKKTIMK